MLANASNTMKLTGTRTSYISAARQIHPRAALFNKDRASYQEEASQYTSSQEPFPSKPITCPPSSFGSTIQDSTYEEEVKHYDALTWSMYNRIMNTRLTKQVDYVHTRDFERFNREERTEDEPYLSEEIFHLEM